MNIEELRTFVEVANAGGVSTAARRMGVGKSVVSRRLARLEEELGVQLLARTTRGAALTEAGATLQAHAMKVVAEIDAAREILFPAGDVRGLLRIAAPLSFGPTHFAAVFARLAKEHPQLQIHTSYTDRFVDLVSEGFDCAVRVGYLQDDQLQVRRVGPLDGKLLASPAYIEIHGAPEVPADLAGHEALMQGLETWQFQDGDRVVTIQPRGRFKADNGTALMAAAVAGLGIAWLPDGLTDEHVASGALVPVMTRHPPPPAGIYVVHPPAKHVPQGVRALIDLLTDCFTVDEHLRKVGRPET